MAKKPDSVPPSPRASFTDTKRVEELIELMTLNGLSEIELVEGQSRILLRRGGGGAQQGAPVPVYHAPSPVAHAVPHAATLAGGAEGGADQGLVPIKSPMVGTFYSAASPDASAYVAVGASVDEKSVVCVIEAMKHFNEVTAEVRGTITRILVSNGQVVEFGQPLFMVRPE